MEGRVMSTADLVLAVLEKHDLKKKGDGRYRCNSPLRPNSNSHAFKLVIKDGEHGAYFDHVAHETGSLYQLADKLGIERPQTEQQDEGTKRAYADLADYAEAHGTPLDAFTRAGWGESIKHLGRPALPFETAAGRRFRFIDGKRPVYMSPSDYQRCWYELRRAVHIAEATDQPLVICNGEASTVATQYRGVAATAITAGENGIPEHLLAELKAVWSGPIIIAPDCDEAGRRDAMQKLATLRAAGYDVRAVDLKGHKGFDLADFARLHGDETPAALQALKDLPDSTPTRRYRTEDEIDQLAPPTWLIKDIVPAGEVTMIIGPGDSGKTFIAVDMVKRVAQHYPVMYVAAEDASGIKLRKCAWELHHRIPKNGNFLMWDGVLPLFDANEVDSFITEVKRLGLRLIVIDTLSQSIAGADENSSKDMTVVMAHLQRIAHETGAAVVPLHHTTKGGETYRGSSTILNNTYGLLHVSRDDDLIKLECGRIKNAKAFPTRFFKLIEVETDITDEAGQPITSCAMLPASHVSNGDRLTSNQLKMLEALLNITDATGGAATTELEKATDLHGNSFYGSLKRLRALGLVDKGEKRTAPIYITISGRKRLADESSNPEYQQDGGRTLDAAPPFEVNPRLGPITTAATGSNDGSNAGGSNAAGGASYQPATAAEPRPEAITTAATELLPTATGSNGSLTTPSLSPLGEGVGSNRGNKETQESDLSHDQRREAEAKQHVAAGRFKDARKAANLIRGRKECLRVLEEIAAAEREAQATS
jgi:hypothetical protein